MNRFSVMAAVAFLCGTVSLLLAAEGLAAAQCDPTTYSPAYCYPAHASSPIENTSGDYCTIDGGQCIQGDDCKDRFGIAYSGECRHTQIGGSGGPETCYEDDHLAIVQVKWYTAYCSYQGGECSCIWSESNEEPAQNVSVCDCRD